jgi:hypothetical protein
MSIIFFLSFIATVIYMALAKFCIEKISEFDDEMTDDAIKNSSVLMKYIFFIKTIGDSECWNGLLWCTRISFIVGLSTYITLVMLIIFC